MPFVAAKIAVLIVMVEFEGTYGVLGSSIIDV